MMAVEQHIKELTDKISSMKQSIEEKAKNASFWTKLGLILLVVGIVIGLIVAIAAASKAIAVALAAAEISSGLTTAIAVLIAAITALIGVIARIIGGWLGGKIDKLKQLLENLKKQLAEAKNSPAHFTCGSKYIQYDVKNDRAAKGFPRQATDSIPGLPADAQIDASVNWGNGKVYLFYGDSYVRFDKAANKVDKGYPKKVGGKDANNRPLWPGLPENFKTGIDAVVNWGNGKVYFFKGGEYVRYDIKNDRVDDGYPKPINGFNEEGRRLWPGMPPEFAKGIDAVVNWGNGKAYFFKGNNYVCYDIKNDRVEAAYEKGDIPIKGNWPGLDQHCLNGIGSAWK